MEEENRPLWRRESNRHLNDYLEGRDGDWLFASFQCEKCHFVNINKRLPLVSSDHDNLLLCYYRRVNLDVFWSRKPGTIAGLLNSTRFILEGSMELGSKIPLDRFEPWPVEDVCGMGLAILLLLKSTKSNHANANSSTHLQFSTIRKLRTCGGTIADTSWKGNSASVTLKSLKGDAFHLHMGSNQSKFYERFMFGVRTRMGAISNRNLPVTSDMVLALLKYFEENLNTEVWSSKKKRLMKLCGALVVLLYGGSLRGNEGFMLDADTLGKHILVGMNHEIPHVLAPLYGFFKNEQGERFHVIPLSASTRSGIEIRRWLELLVVTLHEEGNLGKGGPAFCNEKGVLIDPRILEDIILDGLKVIQDRQGRVEVIPNDIDVYEKFGIYRSFRRGATGTAADQDISEFTIRLMNRWRSFERARGGNPNMGMLDHYLENRSVLRKILSFSKCL